MYLSMNIGRTLTEEPDLKNRLLYKTLELELQKEGGLKVVKNSFNETNDIESFDQRKRFDLIAKDIHTEKSLRDDIKNKGNKLLKTKQLNETRQLQQSQFITQKILQEEDLNDHSHNGLMSALLFEKNKKQEIKKQFQKDQSSFNSQELSACSSNSMKLMICITMFREPLTQLLKSIDGIVDSLQDFMNYGIAPHQIGVCVFFDGIENIHNVIDENGGSFHENIIPYFKAHLDEEYGIKGNKTLDHQYWEYRKHKKFLNDYKPQNIIEMRRNKDYLLKKYKKHKDSLITIMKTRKNGPWLPQDEWIESNIIDAMIHQYHLSKKYIDDRANCAWIYQGRYVYSNCTMPIFYTFKFQNGSKLSSHLWFFKGFCQELQPDYCLLMDCGAIPGPGSIFKLIMSMEAEPKIGGVCGNMRIEEEAESDKKKQSMDILSRVLNQYIFSIQKCQACEYDIGHILDKHYESALNYIHVLPGAFSAYRYQAFDQPYVKQSKELDEIKNVLKGLTDNSQEIQYQSQFLLRQESQNNKNNILDFYLKQVVDPNYEYSSITEANMFLAEDRVLCLLLFCQNYYLKYIPDAEVSVDACQTLVDLLYQRRRWINGSWFALNYVQDHYHEKLKNSDHSWLDQQLFKFSLVSAGISQIQQYFFQTFQIVWIYMILQILLDTSQITDQVQKTTYNIISSAILASYIFLVMMLIFLSITFNQSTLNSIKGSNEKEKVQRQEEIKSYYFSKFYGVSTILGLISLGTLAYTFYLLIQEVIIDTNIKLFVDQPHVPQSYYYLLVVISCGMIAIPFLLSLFTAPKSIWGVFINSIHYFYYQPTYTHLFITYAFCRIDDLSWGTKGLTVDNDAKKISTDKIYKKYLFIIKWIILNCLASGILIMFLRMEVFLLPQCLILIISVIITIICCLKSTLAIVNFIKYYNPFGQQNKRDKMIKNSLNWNETLERGKKFNQELQQYFSAKASPQSQNQN